jgi:hypothetical protein
MSQDKKLDYSNYFNLGERAIAAVIVSKCKTLSFSTQDFFKG